MLRKQTQANGRSKTSLSSADLRRWKRMIEELGEVRVDKVYRARTALRRNEYDRREVIEATAARLCEDARLRDGPRVRAWTTFEPVGVPLSYGAGGTDPG